MLVKLCLPPSLAFVTGVGRWVLPKQADSEGRFVLAAVSTAYPNDVLAVKDGYAVASVKVDPKDEKAATDVVLTLKPELTIGG